MMRMRVCRTAKAVAKRWGVNGMNAGARALVLAGLVMVTGVLSPAMAQGGRGAGQPGTPRAALEERVRDRMSQEVKARLQLDDAQMQRLGATNQKFEAQRRALLAEERAARSGLRAEMLRGDSANQQRVGTILDQLLVAQRRRFDLIEQEQRELAGFLTPVQRARYLAIQDQVRRRMEEMRGGPPRPGPRGRPGRAGAP